MQGIYLVENLINGDYYIGQSKNINYRYKQHISHINHFAAKNYHFYRALKKYGVENFGLHIVELVNEESKLTERETYWYHLLNPKYNMKNPSSSPKKIKKPVYQIDTQTLEIVKRYDSISDAVEKLGQESLISKVCRRKSSKANGYHWCYVEDYNDQWKPKRDGRLGSLRANKRRVQKIDKSTGQLLETYNSIYEAAIKNKLNHSGISQTCSNKYKHCGGFGWKYI
jgi:group I intron endonuclease